MWIAKPVTALNEDEKEAWVAGCRRQRASGADVPLAQTLTWAHAALEASGGSFLVFSPDEGVGGVVLAGPADGGGVRFECINGPLLDWDSPERAKRQLATFAMAVSRLDRSFRTLVLRPRWMAGKASRRLQSLAIPASSIDRAATLRVPIRADDLAQIRGFRPRLRRTFRMTERLLKGASVTPLVSRDRRLGGWVERMEEFAVRRGFAVPSKAWFDALLAQPALQRSEGLSFWLAFAEAGKEGEESSFAELLLCARGQEFREVHYLFGCERRPTGVSLSPSALAHVEALRHFRSAGSSFFQVYDLNGYIREVSAGHPYEGINQFKEQFGGVLLEYEVPEFRIE